MKNNHTQESRIEKAKQTEKEMFESILAVAREYREKPEVLAEYIQFATKFYQFSPNNISLIYAQNPYATFVQSYPAWKKNDASVKRGEKGIKVLAPAPVTYLRMKEGEDIRLSEATKEQKLQYEKGEIEGYEKMYFKAGNVFDISQTTYPKEKYPELFSMGVSSEVHKEVTEGLIAFTEQEINCPVTRENVSSIALKGYYVPATHKIVLNELMEDTVALSTMTHELGHALIHRESQNLSEAQIEFEGDAMSIMLQKRYDIALTEGRKSHLADHFGNFLKECEGKVQTGGKKLSDNKLELETNKLIQASLKKVFKTYEKHINTIDRYVEREMEKEKKQMQSTNQYGSLIREEREKRGMKREELAHLSMLSVQELTEIESGKRELTSPNFFMLANALEIYPSALEHGEVVYQNREELVNLLYNTLPQQLQEIKENNSYIQEFMKRNGISLERYQYREEVERYAVYDMLKGEYVKDEKEEIQLWDNSADAIAYAEELNRKDKDMLKGELEQKVPVPEVQKEHRRVL